MLLTFMGRNYLISPKIHTTIKSRPSPLLRIWSPSLAHKIPMFVSPSAGPGQFVISRCDACRSSSLPCAAPSHPWLPACAFVYSEARFLDLAWHQVSPCMWLKSLSRTSSLPPRQADSSPLEHTALLSHQLLWSPLGTFLAHLSVTCPAPSSLCAVMGSDHMCWFVNTFD